MDFSSLYDRYVATCVGFPYDEIGGVTPSRDDLSQRIVDWLEGLVEDGELLDDQEQILCFTPDEIKYLYQELGLAG